MGTPPLQRSQRGKDTQQNETVRRLSQPVVSHKGPSDLMSCQPALTDLASAAPRSVIALQRVAGNRAVSGAIQAKLTVGGAHDLYEQEADRVAESVVGMPAPAARIPGDAHGVQREAESDEVQTAPLAASISRLIQRASEEEEEVQTKSLVQRAPEEEEEVQTKSLVQRAPEEEEEVQTKSLVQRAPEEEEEVQTKSLIQRAPEEEEEVQTKSTVQRQGEEEEIQTKSEGSDGSFSAGRHVEQRLSSLQGGGSPLPSSVRSHMEPRFGADFGGVRLHTDSEAGQLNRDLQARAFTHGNDIYMGSGASAPGSTDGDRLLAHELTHVIQQSGRKDRVARWGKGMGGGTPHPIVTKMAFASMDPKVRKYFSQEARDYLAEHSDDIDKRFGYLIPVAFKILGGKITKARGKKMYRGDVTGKQFGKVSKGAKNVREIREKLDSEEAERARQYDAIDGYVRNPAEAPNHAEGGMYRSFSGEGAGKFRIDEYVNKAIQQYNSKNPREAMYTLSLALHTTQDKGAHGEGAPGTGHDPRKFFPPPNALAKTGWVYWQKGMGKDPDMKFSSCDNIDQNPRGLQIAEGATHNTLRQFVEGIGVSIGDEGEQSEDELAKASKLISWTKPWWLSRVGREAGRWLGGTNVIKNMRGMGQFG
jgi:hypothetical protein